MVTPRFSIVSAVFNVSKYLDAFIESIEAQDFPLDRVEVIAVDDGSTDDSAAKLSAWSDRHPGLVTVVRKPNGGQASARNVGLQHARGEWVTFTDPDDMLEANYLSEVDTFLRENPTTELVGCNRVLLHDSSGKRGRHPLYRHFRDRNVLRNLDEHPTHFYGSAPCAFFRLQTLKDRGLLFDEAIRPSFEDGYFCATYLLGAERPVVGFVGSATYIYRKRADQSSTMQASVLDNGRFTTVLELGYLRLLRESSQATGRAPEWVQSLVLYDLSWYFSTEAAPAGSMSAAVGAVAERFHELLAQIVDYLDPGMIRTFTVRNYRSEWRQLLEHGYRSEPWHTNYVLADKLDNEQWLIRVVYRYMRARPAEQFRVEGVVTTPVFEKTRDITYFDRVVMYERIVWLPLGTVRVTLDGQDMDVRLSEPDLPVHSLPPNLLRRVRYQPIVRRAALATLSRTFNPGRKARVFARLARTGPVRRVFGRAWVLIDRIHDADDSAEHLFRHLRAVEPDINAWFVIEKGSPDDKRLRKDGYGRRMVPYGSLRWRVLMLNCEQLISSHADVPIMRPAAVVRLSPPRWRFTFLQHGVIKDDLSRWLNDKDIEIFVTSTPAEQASIAGDHTAYRYTDREVKLTGLPRFDRLREQGELVPPAERDLILIAPTWRQWLVPPPSAGTQRRLSTAVGFAESDFVRNWLAMISSPELAALARQHGLAIGLLPHPNLQQSAVMLDLPEHITRLTFDGMDVRRLVARARVLVTDYSSMAFNAAYIDRPVVYFQFDRDRMLGGGHVGRGGYFDYERDGFGPVALTSDEVVKDVTDAVTNGPGPAPRYAERIAATFPERDGQCCARVTEEIRNSTRPVQIG